MNPKLQFDFIVDNKTNSITVKREFAAKRQLVWDCHTKSELLDQWFAPKPLITKTASMDFREGGHWHYVMVDPEGTEYWARMDYKTITPIDSYSALDGFSNSKGELNPQLPRATWDAMFTDLKAHTLVQTIVKYNSEADLQTVLQMGMKEGLTSTLERLDELLLILR
ncbi:MAG: SRPBCC domain-containing protein [Pseudohongiellaceae bacterium]